MTLQQASKVLDISKKRLWRAVKAGQLDASRVQRGGRWEYRVSDQQLESYRRKYLDSLEMRAVSWSEPPAERSTERPMERPAEQPGLHETLVERLAQAERRIVELEHELEQKNRSALQISHAVAIIKEANRREEQLAKLAQVLGQMKAALDEKFSPEQQV